MPLTQRQFKDLELKYGKWASWAIWNPNPKKMSDTQVISEHLDDLKTSIIMVGLNASFPSREPWSGFHLGLHDHKLRLAFNNSSYRGAYITDIFKVVGASAAELEAKIKKGEVDEKTHIKSFRDEMTALEVRSCTKTPTCPGEPHELFIVFGRKAEKKFNKHLRDSYPNVVPCPHFSNFGVGYSHAEYVNGLSKALEQYYRDTRDRFNTPEFVRNVFL